MSVVEIGNYLVFIVYVMVLGKSIQNFINIHKANFYGIVEAVVYSFTFCTILQSAAFMALQVEWIMEDNNESVTDVASWGWMFYDYFNGFALLSFTIALEVYIGWRIPHGKHNKRREDKV